MCYVFLFPTDNVEMDLVVTLFGKNGAQAVTHIPLFYVCIVYCIHSFYTVEHVLCVPAPYRQRGDGFGVYALRQG